MASSPPPILWQASSHQIKNAEITRYLNWLAENRHFSFTDYATLHQWSIQQPEDFWRSLVDYYQLFEYPSDQPVISQWKHDFIGVKWFTGVSLNYAEMIFKNANPQYPALVYSNESDATLHEVSWDELYQDVARLANWMKRKSVQKGDRVVAVLPNGKEAVVAFLAAQSLGAVWSSCSPDFGSKSIIERFEQIDPVLLFFSEQVQYNGKTFQKSALLQELRQALSTLTETVLIGDINAVSANLGTAWDAIMQEPAVNLVFESLPFDHPLWILYSSGTTGQPKAIVHSVGGNLVEHIKVLRLHWDVKKGDRFFWYSTTGWMMWNFSVAALLTGATLVLYDGSPTYPHPAKLWELAEQAKLNHMGVGAAYLMHCLKSNLNISQYDLTNLRTLGATGSPLPPEGYDWVYQHLPAAVWLISFSGGTDICSGFVGGSQLLPLYRGEIQCCLLGVHLSAVNDQGHTVEEDTVGEMVIQSPLPSMPLFFWKDTGNQRYRTSYFEKFPGWWWHGDFISITAQKGIIIYGRSDATLNRDGIRIGTAEIYRVVDTFDSVSDSLIVCIEKKDGSFFMPLFVKMQEARLLLQEEKELIRQALKQTYSPRHVPDVIIEVPDIPYTISGKKMEIPVKRILSGTPPEKAADWQAIRNPEALRFFVDWKQVD